MVEITDVVTVLVVVLAGSGVQTAQMPKGEGLVGAW